MIDSIAFVLPISLGLVPFAFVLADSLARSPRRARIATKSSDAARRQRQGIYLQMGDFHYRTENDR